ncbi:hypothetical protein PGT21_022207 [Puccinia graminis f. sp. tritici]|uniref:Ribosomal protein L9 domain-containing protein n=1 Tax=Puccinia graminis f. sp. tritici TaxID=56615 RepID=A0A5B0PYC6_PUCGR|nr:hypothetical protein PGT21_022207 [Puccinia graminis f. sp. tritici]KAA1131656.1 hypothetical protein PGTUg99_034811 [Puccinia graminis f. sp. tritici]
MTLITSGSGTLRASSIQLAPSSSRWFSSSPCHFVWVQKRIKVQLRTDHPSHGKAGQVIRVKPGHMRQQLFPSGQALYCANDGIPIHHFQPTERRGMKVPAPGLSRPLVELLKRLGVQMPITRGELRGAQAQLNGWKRAANPTNTPACPSPVGDPLPSSSPQSVPLLKAPKGLDLYLHSLSQSLRSSHRPALVFERPGPENSDSLYSSIKADEIIAGLVDQFEFESDQSSSLSQFIKIVGCSDSSSSSSSSSLDPLPPLLKFKPLKQTGAYAVALSIDDPHSSQRSSKDSEHRPTTYLFSILVEK